MDVDDAGARVPAASRFGGYFLRRNRDTGMLATNRPPFSAASMTIVSTSAPDSSFAIYNRIVTVP